MREFGLYFSLVFSLSPVYTEGICEEPVPERTSKFNGIKGG